MGAAPSKRSPPAENLQPFLPVPCHGVTVSPCHGARHRPAVVAARGWEAPSRSPAPGWGAGCSGAPYRWHYVPLPRVTRCLAGGPRGTAGPLWLASTATGSANRHTGGSQGGTQGNAGLARGTGGNAGRVGKNEEKGPNVTSPSGDSALLLPHPLPGQTRAPVPLPGLCRGAQLSLHPPQNPKPGGGQTPPHAAESDSPEQGGGGGRAGSSPLARAGGARRGANFPGLMQDASGSAFAFCGFLGAGQKSHNPTSCTFGFN